MCIFDLFCCVSLSFCIHLNDQTDSLVILKNETARKPSRLPGIFELSLARHTAGDGRDETKFIFRAPGAPGQYSFIEACNVTESHRV
jgi:hypothetical protein